MTVETAVTCPVADAVNQLTFVRLSTGAGHGHRLDRTETADYVTVSAQFDAPSGWLQARIGDLTVRRAFAGVVGPSWGELACYCFAILSDGSCTGVVTVPDGTPEWTAIVNAVFDAR